MANSKSAIKRMKQNEKRRIRNKAVKSRVKHAVKSVRSAVGQSSQELADKELQLAKSIIDKAAKKGVIHKKTASRKISRLSRSVKRIAS